MRRRDFIGLAGAAVALPRLAFAQRPKVWRVAVVSNALTDDRRQAIFDGLASLGYLVGENLRVDVFDAPTLDAVADRASQAVASNPDLIVTYASSAPLAVKRLTTSIPIVMTGLVDPVVIGAVSNYSRPGGNLTGFMTAGPQYAGKQISLVREVLPTITRLADLGLPADPSYGALFPQRLKAAGGIGIDIIAFGTSEGDDLPAWFDRIAKSTAEAVFVGNAGYLRQNYALIADLAIKHRLPSFHDNAGAVPSGMLLGYSANTVDVVRKSMSYVDAIFRGATPGDLPIQQPTAFDLAVNLKTANTLGVTIRQSILLQATHVIS